MRTIIAGSRDCKDMGILLEAIRISGIQITEVVCGMARGADRLGLEWAKANRIPWIEKPADWDNYPGIAGFMRNQEMADIGEQLLLLYDGQSHGSLDMLTRAKKKRIPIFIYNYTESYGPYQNNQ